ncbi:hypothetical protein ACW9KT_19755 [Hymenobacter sp. HD11105]
MVDSTPTGTKTIIQPYRRKAPDGWGMLNTRLPIVNSLAQLVLVTLLGTFAKCSVEEYTHNMERTKRVDDLTTALSTQETDRDITKRNLALVTLDRIYSNPNPSWWQGFFSADEQQADDSLMFSIAEEVYRAGIATTPGVDKTLFKTRLNLARRIMCRRDPKRGKAFLETVYQSTTTISSADTTSTLAAQPANSIPIAPENRALVQEITAINEPDKFCYIQFRAFKRATAQQLQQQLQKKEWNVPGVERKEGNYACTVRYFFPEDSAKAEKALQVTQDFLNTLPNKPKVRLLPLTNKKFAGVRAGQIEIWISPVSS